MSSLILRTATRLIVPLTLLFAAFMALKGHNAPGGGFIGGLIAAVALALQRMANGPEALRNMVPEHPRSLIFFGLALALLTAVIPLVGGLPLLTSAIVDVHLPTGEAIHVASAMFFDLGVLFVVVGVSIGMIIRLSEELEEQ